MRAKWIKKLTCLLLCLGLATVTSGKNDTPSVLELVQNVNDPELAELIRVAIEYQANFRDLNQEEILELTHKVTLSYTQIKMYNLQIQEVSSKIDANSGPVEMRYSLQLAKTELEAKRMTEVANLRKVMGITPRHPFDKQPIKSLSSWVILRVLDEGVYVLDSLQPFHNYEVRRRCKSLGLQSRKEALDFVRKKLNDPNNFPIRIELCHTSDMSFAAKDLRGKVVSLAIETNTQMEAEVCLRKLVHPGSGVSQLFIREGTISTLHKAGPLIRPDGGLEPLGTGIVEPSDLDQHILWRLLRPQHIPLKFQIEYDKDSDKLAKHAKDRIMTIAKDLGISELVKAERILTDKVPESDFLGRWQAITKGGIQTIDIRPTGVCVFVKSPGSKIKGGPSVSGKWFMTPDKIFLDIKDLREWYYFYRGYLDKEGHLVVDIGEIHSEGSFGTGWEKDSTIIFKKVY